MLELLSQLKSCEEIGKVLMMTMGKLVIGLNDWPTRTASNLQQSHLDLTSCQHFLEVYWIL